MGNQPSECHMGDSLRCYRCCKILSPCQSFSDYDKESIHGRLVYRYNGGEYYREVGRDNAYECNGCFYQQIRDQQRREEEEKRRREEERRQEEEKRRREEERRQEEEKRRREEERREQERKMREEAAREAEKKRQEELNQRLQNSQQQAIMFNEKQQQLISQSLEECKTKRDVFISHLDEFEATEESEHDGDKLFEILSSKSSISNLSLSQLTASQVGKIVSVLENLLFDEWIDAPPSLSTLQHAQVLITDLCVVSLEISDGVSLEGMSNHVQSLVDTISQSAYSIHETFLLTQALYLTLVHFFAKDDSSGTELVNMAKRWSEDTVSAERLFPLEFLSTLTLSLESVVKMASVFILKMEFQCFKLFLSTLTQDKDEDTHSESTGILLRLVQMNQWTPKEAMNLFKALSDKYSEDASITKVLTLVQVHGVSPTWTNESGHSLIQTLDIIGPERFHQALQKSRRGQDESNLNAALAELKMGRNLDDSTIGIIQCIISGLLQKLENTQNIAPFRKDSFKNESLEVNVLQETLSQLCKGVFDTKGWWPTMDQMLHWCVLVLTEKSTPLELVSWDPCVTAMFAAMQVCLGNKLDMVLSSDSDCEEQMKEWSDFYRYLGISLLTNKETTKLSSLDVYEADIVYGTIDDFVTDYLQCKLEVMETGCPKLCRGFIMEGKCLVTGHNLKLSRLDNNGALKDVAEHLKCLMGRCFSEKMKLRFVRALFKVLHMNLIDDTSTNILTILQKLTGKTLPSQDASVLKFFETLLKAISDQNESNEKRTSLTEKWCFEIIVDCVEKWQSATDTTETIFQIVSNLVAQNLWTATECLRLLTALTDRHEDQSGIMKILHLLAMYQVSSKWTDENKLSDSTETQNLILHLEENFKKEEVKSIDILYKEISEMKVIDEQTLAKSFSIVECVLKWIENGKIEKFKDVQGIRTLSHSTATEDLQKILAVLCCAVHQCQDENRKWWPRETQMLSWCFLALSDTGKLLEMGTGEGKSCVIAMFAVLRALRGEKVDVVSSSSVLCERDVEEWTGFYQYFGITVDTNTNKTEDKDRKVCYQKDVVYGTIEAFAADHLRQTFEMKDVRPDRGYHCIIIDEVDSLLLDQGVQLTYLSTNMVSMQHLNVILAMIWSHVSQYGLLSTGSRTFVRGTPASFFKAIYDAIDTEGTEMNDALDILQIAEECNIVHKGFAEEICSAGKDELLKKLKTVTQDDLVDFFQEIEQYVHYGFSVYTLDDNGFLCLRKLSLNKDQNIQDLTFLVLEDGLCCPLYDSEEVLIDPIAECMKDRFQYTPCKDDKNKVSVPGFLRNLVEKKMSTWIQNAFLAMTLKQGREYVVQNNSICPVDFRSTGIIELNKKWGDGLQQFVEMKHQVKMSTISAVTNYLSNLSFFEEYCGKIYGTTGTLGSTSDMQFLQDLYPELSAYKMPSFSRKKLFEVKGKLTTSAEEWKSEIKRVVMAEICPTSYRNGRAALVICETINKAKEIHEELKSSITGEIILYSRSDKDSLSKIDKKLNSGDVIVATNLAGRGTDIKVSDEVNNNGGLFVVLSFLSDNTRVELQAFGRTARKGKPGSAQVIMCTDHLHESYRTVSTLEEAREKRDRLAVEKVEHMMNDVKEMRLREELFAEYCKTLKEIYKKTDIDEQRATVAVMNEYWGIWLQIKTEEIDQLKREELLNSLGGDIFKAKTESQSQNSPSSCIYHYIKFGNIAMGERKWEVSAKLFEKAMNQDGSWAAIAYYNHAYCIIHKRETDYITKATEDLSKAKQSLKYLSEECIMCLQFIKMSSNVSASNTRTSLEEQLTRKCNMLGLFDKNINEAIEKLEEIKKEKNDAIAKKAPVFSLLNDEALEEEAHSLYDRGLKYIFTVQEEPRFAWGALAVFFLGVLQIIGGALLTVFTCGTLFQVGMGLITEGISDCITGVESMIKGDFSWKSWAVGKAISIGVSLIGFGVGKLIAKGFKACKALIKGFGKELKSMPKLLSKQAKSGFNDVMRTNMKNIVKHTGKEIMEKTVDYGLEKLEEEVINQILKDVKKEVRKTAIAEVKSRMEKEPLETLVDSIILSHLEDKRQFVDLMENEQHRDKLRETFMEISAAALQPVYANSDWQKQLSSSISKVIDKAKAEVKGLARGFLYGIQFIHMVTLGADAGIAVSTLSAKFFENFIKSLEKFKKKQCSLEKVKTSELSASDIDILKTFKQDLANRIADLLANALVETFHQKFSSHVVSFAQGELHGVIGKYVGSILKSDRTEEKLIAGQNNRYIAYMPVSLNSKEKPVGDAYVHTRSHAERIQSTETAATLLDIRVLSEIKTMKVVIFKEHSNGKLTKLQQVEPSSKAATQTVKLIYRPRSAEYPEGHYDVLINNQTVRIDNKGKSCMFHALARGMNPGATKEEIVSTAEGLRSLEANALHRHPDQWESFIKRKEWTEGIRGGHWFMEEGAGPVQHIKETKEVLQQQVGKVGVYRQMKKNTHDEGIGKFIHADHQPSVDSIVTAANLNQNSKLAKAMLEAGETSTSSTSIRSLADKVYKKHGNDLPTVYVPAEVHREFPSTKSDPFRQLVAEAISKDNIEDTFKLTIIGAMPRFMLSNNQNYNTFQGQSMSQTRLDVFRESFQKHSTAMLDTWFKILRDKNIMAQKDYDTIYTWIQNEDYNNQNDYFRNQVARLLK